MALQIYSFTDPVDFVATKLEEKRKINPRFSLRAWSSQLGYSNPSYLSQVLQKKRRLKIDLAKRVGQNLKLSADDQKFFEALVLFQNCKTSEEKLFYGEVLENLKPREAGATTVLDYERFRIISDWVHIGILELTGLRAFDGSFESIDQLLNHGLSRSALIAAVSRLRKLGLLKVDKSGKLKRGKDTSFLFDQKIPSEAVRHYHQQMIEKAKDALQNQSVDERDLRATTLSFQRQNFKKATDILKRAHKEILALAADKNGDDLYHLQTSFFKLTKKGQ